MQFKGEIEKGMTLMKTNKKAVAGIQEVMKVA